MSGYKQFFKTTLFLVLLPFLFYYLEGGFSFFNVERLVQPMIFTASVFMSFNRIFKRYLLFISLLSLFLMVIFYLFWQLDKANFFGSIGFGMFVIYTTSWLPELIKKGYVERVL